MERAQKGDKYTRMHGKVIGNPIYTLFISRFPVHFQLQNLASK